MSSIACIGSRETPKSVLTWMERMGAALVRAKHEIRSGNAPGADQTWARGGNAEDAWKVTICLPWASFERHACAPGNTIIVFDPIEHVQYRDLAALSHPRWAYLNARAQKLHARNALIVAKADRVLGYLNHTNLGYGGTGSAFRIAHRIGIPTQDVSKPEVRATLEKEFGL